MPKNTSTQGAGWGVYLAGVGAAAATTFFDRVRNGEVSALRKTGIALREMIGSNDFTSGNASMLALLIFCLVTALMVFVYSPREQKEAFVLGLGVLAAMGMAIAPPEQTTLHAAPTAPLAPVHVSEFSWISSAHAQPTPAAEQSRADDLRTAGIWVFLDGPQRLQPRETRVLVFSLRTHATVLNAPASPAFQLSLPAGSYQFEISHIGYRSTVFNLDLKPGSQAIQVPMEAVNMELLNFFGPAKGRPKIKADWAQKLDNAAQSCAESHDRVQAAAALKGLDKRWLNNLSDEARRTLCQA
ncbi:hypothetical protein [Roseateles sp.]|uniref:hypothetical protein n=1 Tax=Roseateles sp. TaxID=1971397 RepID=UPI003267F5E7